MVRKVLIVDDDPNIVGFVRLLLESEGYTVAAATNGKEALEQLKSFDPHVVLLDMVMPVMDGWEFARRLQDKDASFAKQKSPAVVVMSASVDARKTCAEIGASGYLSKPFDLDHLLACVESFFKREPVHS